MSPVWYRNFGSHTINSIINLKSNTTKAMNEIKFAQLSKSQIGYVLTSNQKGYVEKSDTLIWLHMQKSINELIRH